MFRITAVWNYLHDNWLAEFRHKFVSCWVDKHQHFRNYTTNRVESSHALLKEHLEHKKSTFPTLLAAINKIVPSQMNNITHSFEFSRTNLFHKHNSPFYRLLNGRVSHYALDLIVDEVTRLKSIEDDLVDRCGHLLQSSCGIPCACQLSVLLKSG